MIYCDRNKSHWNAFIELALIVFSGQWIGLAWNQPNVPNVDNSNWLFFNRKSTLAEVVMPSRTIFHPFCPLQCLKAIQPHKHCHFVRVQMSNTQRTEVIIGTYVKRLKWKFHCGIRSTFTLKSMYVRAKKWNEMKRQPFVQKQTNYRYICGKTMGSSSILSYLLMFQ